MRTRDIYMKLKASKLFVSLVCVFICVAVVSAGWLFTYNKTITGEVIGEGEMLEIVLDLSDFQINISSGELTNGQSLKLKNDNSERYMVLGLDINKTLTEAECPDFENDCVIKFYNSTEIISDGEDVLLKTGQNYFSLNTTCEENSCGQDLEITISLTE
ncbi:unnamed protein product [marine sediment metagenome]|uniref:Uncharacterized protein n=1 Tax=marine sediment metagenome TaxID=412755 RepID=X1CQZ8_9ZZZZ